MKQAKAAFEIIPTSLWGPFLFFLLPRSLYLTTTQNVGWFLAYSLIGGGFCEVASRSLRDRYYWPLVASVYKEIILAEQQQRSMMELSFQNMQSLVRGA